MKKCIFLIGMILGAGVAYAEPPNKTQSLTLKQRVKMDNNVSASWRTIHNKFENALPENTTLGTITLNLANAVLPSDAGVYIPPFINQTDACTGQMISLDGHAFNVRFNGAVSENVPLCTPIGSIAENEFKLDLVTSGVISVPAGTYKMTITPAVYL